MSSKKSKDITWDTTQDPIDYPEIIKKKFFSLSLSNRKQFVKWIGKLSKNFDNDFNWWIQIPATRDQYRSILFKCIIILEVLKDKKLKNRIQNLIVESKNFKKILIKNKVLNLSRIKIKIKNNFLEVIKSIIFNFIVFILVKFFGKDNKINIVHKINLIDTIIDHREVKNDIIYPSIGRIFKKNKLKNFFFVPTFVINKNIFNLIKNINKIKNKNYIFKESLISFKDFFYILTKSLFKKELNLKFTNYNSIDYSDIINEELISKREFYNEFQSRLNFIFVKKLYSINIKVKKIILRFENQSIDKAWVLAFRNFYSKSVIVGYQGFTYCPQLPHQSPADFEDKAKVLPHYIIVTGKIFKKPRLEFYNQMRILIGPTLNKQEIFKKKIIKKYNLKFVLALSGIKSLDKKMCEWVFFSLLNNKSLKVTIKPHPILPLSQVISDIPGEIKKQVLISKDSAEELLKKTEVLISSGPTGIILESLVYGCKLIYLNLDPNDNLIIKKFFKIKKYFNFINSKHDLILKMNYFNRKKSIKKNNNLKNLFFTKITKKNIKIFE